MIKQFEKLETKINEMLAKDFQNIHECKESIDITSKTIEQENNNLITAQERADFEAYNTAKKNLWTAENTKELQLKLLHDLETKALVTPQESTELKKEIIRIADEIRSSQFKKANELLLELEALANESNELNLVTNDLLSKAEYDLMKLEKPYSIHDLYSKDLVRGLYSQIENVAMFDIAKKEASGNK